MSRTPPKIGIPVLQLQPDPQAEARLSAYRQAVAASGGQPVLLPITSSTHQFDPLLRQVRGLLLPGGGDVDPARYGQPSKPGLRDVDPRLDEHQLGLAGRAVRQGLPFLAICRGLQVLNVALGGSLIQDLPRELPGCLAHESPDGPADARHLVEIEPASGLFRIVGQSRIEINSSHHQAADRIGAGLEISAHSADGVVEALELAGHPFGLAVQWHPERLPGDEAGLALIRALVDAAADKETWAHG